MTRRRARTAALGVWMRSRLSGRTSAGEMYRMRADQDPDVWTLVDACTECGQRRRMAGSEWCEACRQQNGKLE